MSKLEEPKYKCKLCGKVHGVRESCRIPANAPYYTWGYEWLGTPGRSDEICWVVPVADRTECDAVSRYFYRGWDLKCTGGDKDSPFDPGRTKVYVNNHVDHIIIFRWAPDIVKDVETWKKLGEPGTEPMFPPDEEDDA